MTVVLLSLLSPGMMLPLLVTTGPLAPLAPASCQSVDAEVVPTMAPSRTS